MSAILFCKNKPVYKIDTSEVLDKKLVPDYIGRNPGKDSFEQWIKFRYCTQTNTFARSLRGKVFKQGNREKINSSTYMLSLTDCYWVKEEDNPISFEEVSPYFVKYWTGEDKYVGGSIPTLYIPGFVSKAWTPDGNIFKAGALSIEIDCINLCKFCGVPVEDGIVKNDGIELVNFTNSDVMLVQADASGMIDPDYFTDQTIIDIFGLAGVQMLTIDAIIGNDDRHAGNFGFLQDSNTGDYIGMAPLYDFDHALDDSSAEVADVFLDSLSSLENEEYVNEVLRICKRASEFDVSIFSQRASYILNELEKNTSRDQRG